jgi:hypothetical protein
VQNRPQKDLRSREKKLRRDKPLNLSKDCAGKLRIEVFEQGPKL